MGGVRGQASARPLAEYSSIGSLNLEQHPPDFSALYIW